MGTFECREGLSADQCLMWFAESARPAIAIKPNPVPGTMRSSACGARHARTPRRSLKRRQGEQSNMLVQEKNPQSVPM